MGLAGYGKYNYLSHAMIDAYLLDANHTLPKVCTQGYKKSLKEDIAFTLQQVTIDPIKKYVYFKVQRKFMCSRRCCI